MMRALGIVAALAAVAVPSALAIADAPRPTLALRPAVIPYGKAVTLSGVVPSRRAGERVAILAQACRFTAPAAIAHVRTGRGGTFRYTVEPLINTTFSAEWRKAKSVARAVRVRAGLKLKRLAAGRYRAEVYTTNGHFLDGRAVEIQREGAGTWATVASAVLERASSEFALTLVSAATVDVAVPAGAKLRLVLPQSQATCYAAATSAAIES